MIALYITLPITATGEERSYALNLFESQFKHQIASHVPLSYTLEIELPDLVPFTEEQIRYLRDKPFRLESTPDVKCKVCHREPRTDEVAAVRVEEPTV